MSDVIFSTWDMVFPASNVILALLFLRRLQGRMAFVLYATARTASAASPLNCRIHSIHGVCHTPLRRLISLNDCVWRIYVAWQMRKVCVRRCRAGRGGGKTASGRCVCALGRRGVGGRICSIKTILFFVS